MQQDNLKSRYTVSSRVHDVIPQQTVILLYVFIKTSQLTQFLYAIGKIEVRLYINTLRTGDADLRFYITTVQDG